MLRLSRRRLSLHLKNICNRSAGMKKSNPRKKKSKNCNQIHLPEELLFQIFSRLPTRTIGRCRCLSRLWRDRLSSSQFLNLHFTLKPHIENLILISRDRFSIYTITFPLKEEPAFKNLEIPNTNGWRWHEVVGSVDGLFLIGDKRGEMFLVNPVSGDQVRIPNSAYSLQVYPWWICQYWAKMHGFGYDSSSDDYKIVSLHVDNYCCVYSVKKGVWVQKNKLPSSLRIAKRASGALVNGALHWVATDTSGPLVIVAFDLATEEFHLLSLPACADGSQFSSSNAFVLGGCLGIVEVPYEGKSVVDAWVMKEYGLIESWTNIKLRVNMRDSRRYTKPTKPLCYIEEDEVVLVDQNTKSLIVSNVKDQSKKEILGDIGVVADGGIFVEGLVSPKQVAMEVGPPKLNSHLLKHFGYL